MSHLTEATLEVEVILDVYGTILLQPSIRTIILEVLEASVAGTPAAVNTSGKPKGEMHPIKFLGRTLIYT